MAEETELHEIWFEGGTGGYEIGRNAHKIMLVADGMGISGRYDRIHVYHAGKQMTFPAHHVHGWLVKEGQSHA